MKANPYNIDLDRNPANHQPLTPLTFLERAATVFPDHTAIIHGALRCSYVDDRIAKNSASEILEKSIFLSYGKMHYI
jgi:fatty-acyl-CoA synthase